MFQGEPHNDDSSVIAATTIGLPVSADDWEWVERWLNLWADDQLDPDLRLGLPRRAAGFVAGGWGGYRDTSAEWEAQETRKAIGVIDAAMNDLSPDERAAVMHMKLAAVFMMRDPVEVVYARARQKIGVKLRAADFQ